MRAAAPLLPVKGTSAAVRFSSCPLSPPRTPLESRLRKDGPHERARGEEEKMHSAAERENASRSMHHHPGDGVLGRNRGKAFSPLVLCSA